MNLIERKPVVSAGAVSAVVPAVVAVLAAFNVWTPTPEQLAAISGLIVAIIGVTSKTAAGKVYAAPNVPPLTQAAADTARAGALADVEALGRVQNVQVITAGVFTPRTGRWEVVHLKPEATLDAGTFRLTDAFHNGLQVAEYLPTAAATHSPLGPVELERMGLRVPVPHPSPDGN